jgi:hypothetical protein
MRMLGLVLVGWMSLKELCEYNRRMLWVALRIVKSMDTMLRV